MKKLITFSMFVMIVLVVFLGRAVNAQTAMRPKAAKEFATVWPGVNIRFHKGRRHHRHIAYIRPTRMRRHRI